MATVMATLDENGNEKSIFEQGADVHLVLMLNNKSEEDFLWEFTYGCQLLQQEDFLLVYRISGLDQGGAGQPIRVGKPYRFPIYCLDINLPPKIFPPGERPVASAFWSSDPENLPLSPGRYFSEFSLTLNIEGTGKALELRVDFEVE